MPLVAILLLLGAVGAAATLMPAALKGAPARLTKYVKKLEPGKWYKLTLEVRAGTSPQKVSSALVAQGFTPETPLVTGPRKGTWIAIGPYIRGPGLLRPDRSYRALLVEEVTAPPQDVQYQMAGLDRNLPSEMARAVAIAIVTEKNPAQLLKFAMAMLPDYPVAAAMMRTHATLLSASTKVATGALTPRAAYELASLVNETSTGGFFDSLGRFISRAAAPIVRPAEAAYKAIVPASTRDWVVKAAHTVESVASTVGHVITDLARAAVIPIDASAHLMVNLAKGKSLLHSLEEFGKANLESFQKVGPWAATVISFFPGVGAAIASGIATGVALSEGKPIDQAAIDAAAAALPGGAAVHMAFRTAVKFGTQLAKGKRLEAALLESARAALPVGKLGDIARSAFDTGLAIAHGKALQDVGFTALRNLLPGDAAKQALAFTERVVKHGGNIAHALEQELKSELVHVASKLAGPVLSSVEKAGGAALASLEHSMHGVSELVHKSVAAIVKVPVLAKMTSEELAKKLGVAEPIARAALASVSVPSGASAHLNRNLVIVKPDVLARLLPPPPVARVNGNAIRYVTQRGLAAAQADAARARHQGLATGNTRVLAKARDIAQAARMLQRRRYVDHYLRVGAGVHAQVHLRMAA